MSDIGTIRLSKVAKEIGVGINTIVEHLGKKGVKIESNPNTKISENQYAILLNDFQSDKKTKEDVKLMSKPKPPKKEEVIAIVPPVKAKETVFEEEDDEGILIKSGLVPDKKVPVSKKAEPAVEEVSPEAEPVPATKKTKEITEPVQEVAEADDKPGLTVVGKIL